MSPTIAPPPVAVRPITVALRQTADCIARLHAQGGRTSEQDTKRILVTPAIEALGWDILDIDEVRNEYRPPPTTQLYVRRRDDISLDEVERLQL